MSHLVIFLLVRQQCFSFTITPKTI